MTIMMGLLQIGESLNRIDREYLEKYNLLEDTKGAYNVRNFIAHNYEGVIRVYLPRLKKKVLEIQIEFRDD